MIQCNDDKLGTLNSTELLSEISSGSQFVTIELDIPWSLKALYMNTFVIVETLKGCCKEQKWAYLEI
jgi:hypothetical protein